MRLRPPVAADAEALLEFFERLSDRSLYQRFHGRPPSTSGSSRRCSTPDWVERGRARRELSEDAIVAVANYVRLRDPRRRRSRSPSRDEFQGRGIGTRLLEQLAGHARAAGIEEFIAEVMLDNSPMLRVFADAGFETQRELVAGDGRGAARLGRPRRSSTRVDERDHVAVAASLRPFFEPSTVAVVGASPRRGTIGGELFRNVLARRLRRRCYPVNRSATRRGRARLPGDRRDPGPVDLAVICVPGAAVLDAAAARSAAACARCA